MVRGWIAIAVVLAMLGQARAEGAGERLRLGYRMEFAGIHLLDFEATAELGEQAFRATVDGRTVGLFDTFTSWSGSEKAEGAVEAGVLRPRRYAFDTEWRGEPRAIAMAFQPDGRVVSRAEPPAEGDEREAVADALLVGSLDRLTALLSFLHAVGRDGRCAGTWPVWDGRRRFDIAVADAGEERLEASDEAIYAGPALRCRVSFTPIAGFKRPVDEIEPRPALVWLGAVAGSTLPVPVRAEAETDWGTLTVALVDDGRQGPPPAKAQTDPPPAVERRAFTPQR
jgi:hypothetical protein